MHGFQLLFEDLSQQIGCVVHPKTVGHRPQVDKLAVQRILSLWQLRNISQDPLLVIDHSFISVGHAGFPYQVLVALCLSLPFGQAPVW